MELPDSAAELQQHGVALLGDAFPKDVLIEFRDAAARCFHAIETQPFPPERCGFNRFSNSAFLAALADFGAEELTAPLSVAGLGPLFSETIGDPWTCRMEQSWVRKKLARLPSPGAPCHSQGWHQDGALGVRFPSESGPEIPIAQLLTCWIPLQACGRDSPGLEFVRCRQPTLLHFTDLDDSSLRRRFPPQAFWAPSLELGDGLVFLNGTLHRTHTSPKMQLDRLSIEYRIFPADLMRA